MSSCLCSLILLGSVFMVQAEEFSPQIKALTAGPQFHWFGYYDKFQFDVNDRYVLSMQVDFEHRSPTPDDVISIGMIDLEDGSRWIELGETRAWCWQQGCMLQWRPGSATEVLWNDREDERFVCRILDVESRQLRTLPHPVYHVSPDGQYALGLDFARLEEQRPGYGYKGVVDPYTELNAPQQSTIYRLDLDTGERTDLISLADIEKIRFPNGPAKGKLHFNHIQWSPCGERFIFFSRLNGNNATISYTASSDGSDIRYLGKNSSHFQWRDSEYVTIWADRAYRLYRDDGSGSNKIQWKAGNGHQSYLPHNKDWMITDTYPEGKKREQTLYLYHLPSKKKVILGRFPLPKAYTGEWRCDLHPRLSRDGTKVVIDSPHAGNGRQLYMINIGPIINSSQTP